MNKLSILFLFLFLCFITAVTGCITKSNNQSTDVISIDIKSNYPKLILKLQDIVDVEYIALETTDEFVTQGAVQAVGKNILLVKNWGNNGDIFLFDRKTGKGIRKINRLGQGAEEYSQLTGLLLDEHSKEIFVKDNPARRILVYDFMGNFKRKFSFSDTGYYMEIFDYNNEHLLCYNGYLPEMENDSSAYVLVSKHDGKIMRKVKLPYERLETPVIIEGEATVTPIFCLATPFSKGWILMRASSDTIYHYSHNGNINPMLIRTPSIHTMDTKTFLFPYLFTQRYYFMQLMEKSMDFNTFKGFPTIDLVYDKQEKVVYTYKMYNQDFTDDRSFSLSIHPNTTRDSGILAFKVLQSDDLVNTLKENKLQGTLKDIVSTLDEESNPVVMLIKYKSK